jgi:type II secretory pathway component HofQ
MNRSPASLEQGGVPYPQGVTPDPLRKELRLKLSVTPTLRPDQRVTLDVDTTMTFAGTVVITAGGTPVPSIDSIQVKNQVLLNSGATIMLDLTKERTGRGAGADAGRRLVAFVTPTLVSAAAAPSR